RRSFLLIAATKDDFRCAAAQIEQGKIDGNDGFGGGFVALVPIKRADMAFQAIGGLRLAAGIDDRTEKARGIKPSSHLLREHRMRRDQEFTIKIRFVTEIAGSINKAALFIRGRDA